MIATHIENMAQFLSFCVLKESHNIRLSDHPYWSSSFSFQALWAEPQATWSIKLQLLDQYPPIRAEQATS